MIQGLEQTENRRGMVEKSMRPHVLLGKIRRRTEILAVVRGLINAKALLDLVGVHGGKKAGGFVEVWLPYVGHDR